MPKDYIEVASVKAKALWFASPFGNDTHYYIAPVDDEVYRQICSAPGVAEYKKCTPVNTEQGHDKWFMCYVEDCFDPPIAIVNADDESEAIDLFVYSCKWARMDEKMVIERDNDGLAETVSYGDTGVPYDNETICVRPIKLIRIDC